MGLMLPQTSIVGSQSNFSATPSVTASGTTVTASGSTNTKGAWAELITTTNFEVLGFSLSVSATGLSGSQRNMLLDLGVGAAGSEQVVLSNINLGSVAAIVSNRANVLAHYFPVRIAAATRIAARIQSGTASQAVNVMITVNGQASSPPGLLFAGVDMLGANTGTSNMVALTAGTLGAESAWTNIGSTTARQYFAIMPMVAQNNNAAMTVRGYHVEVGYSSTTIAEYYFSTTAEEDVGQLMPPWPHLCRIPTGTQMQVRAECSGVGESLSYGILAYY